MINIKSSNSPPYFLIQRFYFPNLLLLCGFLQSIIFFLLQNFVPPEWDCITFWIHSRHRDRTRLPGWKLVRKRKRWIVLKRKLHPLINKWIVNYKKNKKIQRMNRAVFLKNSSDCSLQRLHKSSMDFLPMLQIKLFLLNWF